MNYHTHKTIEVRRINNRRGDMNSNIENENGSCSLVVDPELNPATAAVDQLKYFPEWDFKRVRLLSERDEDFGDMIDENNDHYVYDFQILGYEKLTRGAFNMNSLSQISESISRECGRSARTNPTVSLVPSRTDIRSFYPIQKAMRGRDAIIERKRPLVRCIACGSRLSQLDSPPSNTVHERHRSAISHAPSRKFSE